MVEIKKILLLVCINCLWHPGLKAQGKFAGPVTKKLIGVTYKNDHAIAGLKGYKFREGSVVSNVIDPDIITVDVFTKGTTYVVFFSITLEKDSSVFEIQDVVEIKNVQPGWDVRTAACRWNKQDNVEIVAWLKPSKTGYSTNVKQAWRFSRDKRRFESVKPKEVDCLNEGED